MIPAGQADQADETLTLGLSSPENAVLAGDQATGTILDDDLFLIFLPLVGWG